MSVSPTNLPQLKIPLTKSASILGVPSKLQYPLKDSLYSLRRTEPCSPSFLSRQFSINLEERLKISQEVSHTIRKVSSMDSEATRKFSFKDLLYLKKEKPADVSPSYQDFNTQVLERLRRTAKRKQLPQQRSLQNRPTSDDMADQVVSPQLQLPPVVTAAQWVDDQTQLHKLMIAMGFRSANSPSPTKTIRKVVGLDKLPFGSHHAYNSDIPFRTAHIVEKESAKWLNVHSSKRSFRRSKVKSPSKRDA